MEKGQTRMRSTRCVISNANKLGAERLKFILSGVVGAKIKGFALAVIMVYFLTLYSYSHPTSGAFAVHRL